MKRRWDVLAVLPEVRGGAYQVRPPAGGWLVRILTFLVGSLCVVLGTCVVGRALFAEVW